jgi:hypothetical protein
MLWNLAVGGGGFGGRSGRPGPDSGGAGSPLPGCRRTREPGGGTKKGRGSVRSAAFLSEESAAGGPPPGSGGGACGPPSGAVPERMSHYPADPLKMQYGFGPLRGLPGPPDLFRSALAESRPSRIPACEACPGPPRCPQGGPAASAVRRGFPLSCPPSPGSGGDAALSRIRRGCRPLPDPEGMPTAPGRRDPVPGPGRYPGRAVIRQALPGRFPIRGRWVIPRRPGQASVRRPARRCPALRHHRFDCARVAC